MQDRKLQDWKMTDTLMMDTLMPMHVEIDNVVIQLRNPSIYSLFDSWVFQ